MRHRREPNGFGPNSVDLSYYMNVPGIEVEVHDFERNIESDSDNFTSAVFEAGGIIHQLNKVKGRVNRNVTNGRIHQDDTYTLDGKEGYKTLFDVFNERNLLTNQSIYDYGKIRVKALNGQIMGASPYPYGNGYPQAGYPNQYPNGYPNQAPYPNQYPSNGGVVPPSAYSSNSRVRTGTTKKGSRSRWKASLPFFLIALVLIGVGVFFLLKPVTVEPASEVKGSSLKVDILYDFIGEDKDAYALIVDDNQDTVYYFVDMDVDLSAYENKTTEVSLVLNVGENESLRTDHDFHYEDKDTHNAYTYCAEAYSIQIGGNDIYTLEDYENSKKGSNLAIGAIVGGVGLLLAVFGVIGCVKKR